MTKSMKPQVIKVGDVPAFAVLPWDEWRAIQDRLEGTEDERAAADAKARAGEAFPFDLAKAIVDGQHPVRVYRRYRGLTQTTLAKAVGVTPLTISYIETGRRRGSLKLLRRLAKALAVELADLEPTPPDAS